MYSSRLNKQGEIDYEKIRHKFLVFTHLAYLAIPILFK